MSKTKVKTHTVQAGNTQVEVVEENGIVTVRIQSDDAVVYMNNDLIWSIGNEKEEFKYVPHNLHSFLLDSGMDFIKYEKETKITSADIYIDGEQLTLYIPVNQKKQIHARFDLINSVKEVKEYLDECDDEDTTKPFEEELVARFEEIKQLIASKRYKMVFSHSMNEWAFGWWDIVFSAQEFNQENVVAIMKKVNEFNQFIHRMRDTLKLY